MVPFVHLHVHTHHSVMRSTARVEPLLARAASHGARALAITDEWTLAGVPRFLNQAREVGIRPVVGMEIRVRPQAGERRRRQSYQLVLLARNATGYRNLCSLVGLARRGIWERWPAVIADQLQPLSSGLAALSANVHGEVGALLAADRADDALEAARDLAGVFGERNVYLELQQTNEYRQADVNAGQREIAEKLGLPVVATNPVHHVDEEHAHALEVMLCIDHDSRLLAADSPRLPGRGYHLRRDYEMWTLFEDDRSTLEATVDLARRCRVDIEEILDLPPPPSGRRDEQREKLAAVSADASDNAALDWERDVLLHTDDIRRFLAAHELVRACRRRGVPLGPGVGPSVSSTTLRALGVTGIDPAAFGLLSERYLDPDREVARAIPLDIHPSRLADVLACAEDEMGAAYQVVRLPRFQRLGGRSLVDAATNVLDVDSQTIDRGIEFLRERWSRYTDQQVHHGTLLGEIARQVEELSVVLEMFASLDGCMRSADPHESAFALVCRATAPPLPVRSGDGGVDVAEYDCDSMTRAGHVVFELLGSSDALRLARTDALIAGGGADVPAMADCAALLASDGAVQDLLAGANTLGVHALEDRPHRKVLSRVRPVDVEELMAVVALGRYGPMRAGLVDAYADGRGGIVGLDEEADLVADGLRPTRGVLLYQEQVMRIVADLTTLDLCDGARLVQVLGRRNEADLNVWLGRFQEQCWSGGLTPEQSTAIWNWLDRWTWLTMSRAGAASRALLASKQAWQKAHHPAEFFAALLSDRAGSRRRVVRVVRDAAAMGVSLLAPDVERSEAACSVEDGRVRLGLALVRGMDDAAVRAILEARESTGGFEDLGSCLTAVGTYELRVTVLRNLVSSGALDRFEHSRAALWEGIGIFVKAAARIARDGESGQCGLFPGGDVNFDDLVPDVRDWSREERALREVEALGFSLTPGTSG